MDGPPSGSAPVFRPFEVRWDAPQLSEAELRATRNAFEWWYFDLQTDDGVEMVIVFSRQNPIFSDRKPTVYVEYKDADQSLKQLRNYGIADFRWEERDDQHAIHVAHNTVTIHGSTPDAMAYQIELDLPSVSASLTLTPRALGFLPFDDGCYFRDPSNRSRRTCVSFSTPLTDVAGEVTVRGRRRRVQGTGYHDHPWGTEQLFWTHRQWHWGRTPGIMFARVRPAAAFEGQLTFFYSWEEASRTRILTSALDLECEAWRKDSLLGIAFPHTVGVAHDGHSMGTAHYRQSLLDTPAYNRCLAQWARGSGAGSAEGWLECFDLKPSMRVFAYVAFKVMAFFWRPFPYIGR